MNQKLDLEKYKKQLIEEQERIMLEHQAMGANASEEGYELSDYDQHPADAATDTFMRTTDFAIDENYKGILEQIEEALRKIEQGTYGKCDRCGKDIRPERLRAIPYATLCIDCQESLERR
ncbi:MAG: TraR/DksA C4-type zinc finger protein [Armatimonadota bacterium]|nr:TraR/DksA C4-type zinc finger protein [bacterium]